MAGLRYHSGGGASSEAALRFMFQTLGIDAEACADTDSCEGPHLIHGDPPAGMANVVSIVDRPGDVLWPRLLDGDAGDLVEGDQIPFDLIRATAALLDDAVHAGMGTEALDGHGRLRYLASLPAEAGYGDLPIVNVYVAYVGRLLHDRLGMTGRPRWPDGKVAAIGLSHDVDMPDRYALLDSAARPWRLKRSPRTYLRTSLKLAKARVRDRDPDDFWLFDEVAGSEADRGFSSTFFFATVPFYDRAGAPQDVPYDIGSRAFRPVFRALLDSGFEIGLHASYRAFERPGAFAKERARLSECADTEVKGLRHHYWHLGPDIAQTLRAHETAGFTYDSSLAFNEHIGFRRSVALPFHPYDAALGRPLRTLQLPTFCMDGNFFYSSSDIDAAVSAVAASVDRIVATGGFGAIDWHIQTSFPGNPEYRAWGTAYQEILGVLASRPDVWTTNMGAVAAWVDR